MNEEVEQNAMDVKHELDGAKAKITQFEGHESRVQTVTSHVVRRGGRLKDGYERIRDQLIKSVQLDLNDCPNGAFTALETPTTNHRGLLGGTVHCAVTRITDGLKAPVETIEGLCGPSAIGD